MKLRVVGGPIRRSDRVVIDVTSHSTFEAILEVVNRFVEDLDLTELARDAALTPHPPLAAPATVETRPPAPSPEHHCTSTNSDTEEFGTRVEESGTGSDDDTDDPPTLRSKPTVASKRRPAACPQPQGQAAAGPDSSTALLPLRLSRFPVDTVHYDVCLFELESPDNRAKVTRLCRPHETPRSVGMRIPAVALMLKRAFRGDDSYSLPTAMGTGHVDPMAMASLTSRVGDGPLRSAVSPPLLAQVLSPQTAYATATLSPQPLLLSPMDGYGGHNSGRGWSRSQSFGHGQPQAVSNLERLAMLYRVSRSDATRWNQLERTLERLPAAKQERWLELATDVVAAGTGREASHFDSPLSISFSLASLHHLMTCLIHHIDPQHAEGASISADMAVHAAPMGEERSFAVGYLGRLMEDRHAASASSTSGLSADLCCPAGISNWGPLLLVRCKELCHREHLVRLALTHAYLLLVRALKATGIQSLMERATAETCDAVAACSPINEAHRVTHRTAAGGRRRVSIGGEPSIEPLVPVEEAAMADAASDRIRQQWSHMLRQATSDVSQSHDASPISHCIVLDVDAVPPTEQSRPVSEKRFVPEPAALEIRMHALETEVASLKEVILQQSALMARFIASGSSNRTESIVPI